MTRRRRIMLLLTLIITVGIFSAASLWVWERYVKIDTGWETAAEDLREEPPGEEPEDVPREEPTEEPDGTPTAAPTAKPTARPTKKPEATPAPAPEIPAPVTPATMPSFVSLRTVDSIISRPRAETATVTEVKAETWEMWGVMNFHKDLTYLSTRLGDISMLEAYKDDGEEKPLLLFLHGLGEDKETVIDTLSAFAEAGYHAVGVDAFDQGDRYLWYSSVDTWAAVLITVADIDPIIEYYRTVEDVDAERFVLGGFSMGAVEATAYLESGSYKPAAVLAFCGMCQYDAWQTWRQQELTYGWMSAWWGSVWSFPENQERGYTREKYETILSMDISSNLDCFTDVPILCCIGTADYFFNASNIRYVVGLIKDSGNQNADCIVYPRGTHQITGRMLSDSAAFLESVI